MLRLTRKRIIVLHILDTRRALGSLLAAALTLSSAAAHADATDQQVDAAEPKPLATNPMAIYPDRAFDDAAVGRVEVKITVGPDGTAKKTDVLYAAPLDYGFREAAVKAARAWRFEPAADKATKNRTYDATFEFRPSQPLPLRQWSGGGPGSSSPVTVGADNALVVQKAGGWLRTPRWFSDFALDLEFRVVEPGSKAGLLIRARPAEGPVGRTGYRINLGESIDGPDAVGRVTARALEGEMPVMTERTFNPLVLKPPPLGEWQRLHVETDDGIMKVSLNGSLISIVDAERRTGHIGLEGDAGRIEVRNTRIERRETFYRPLPAVDGKLPYVRVDKKSPEIKSPKLIKEVRPDYSTDAMRGKVQGHVYLEAIVRTDGSVGPIRVTRSLHPDLDQSAVTTVRQWQFAPATKDGKDVPCYIEIEMSFTLR